MYKTLALSCLAGVSLAASGVFNYVQNGADWYSIQDADGMYPNELCASGVQQSPIDLSGGVYEERVAVELRDYASAAAEVSKQEHTILVTGNTGEFTKTFEQGMASDFTLVQFHFHSPSEHTINGKLYDLEMHMVHTYMDGSLGAVIGIMFDRDDFTAESMYDDNDHWFLDQLGGVFRSDSGSVQTKVSIDNFLRDIDTDNFWSYDGSLTTPPCTEGIKWTVLEQVQPMSQR